MKIKYGLLAIALVALCNVPAYGQPPMVVPPGEFTISGVPVSCGSLPTVIDMNLPDTAMFNGSAILVNPSRVVGWPTPLKMWAYAHECGHFYQGVNEMAADCWAIKTGRNQGWFPPAAFNSIIALFQSNPGDLHHPPGVVRIENMRACYSMP